MLRPDENTAAEQNLNEQFPSSLPATVEIAVNETSAAPIMILYEHLCLHVSEHQYNRERAGGTQYSFLSSK